MKLILMMLMINNFNDDNSTIMMVNDGFDADHMLQNVAI